MVEFPHRWTQGANGEQWYFELWSQVGRGHHLSDRKVGEMLGMSRGKYTHSEIYCSLTFRYCVLLYSYYKLESSWCIYGVMILHNF